MNAPIPGRTVTIDPEAAERVVSSMADRAGVLARDAYSPADVVQLLRGCGYAVVPDTLREFITKRYVGDPGDTWDAIHVYALLGALESRRRWLPTPNAIHDAKKSGARLMIEQAVAVGEPPIADLDQHTAEDLMIQLAQCDDRGTRECLYEALRCKLEGLEE